MQTMTSAYANKMLKSLEEDKAFWVNKEATSSTYVAAINEEPVVPEYDYTEVVATITSLDEKIAIIKHALNVTNSNEKVRVGDAEMSIDTILIKMAQLNKRKSVLDQMRKQLPKAREEQRSYMSRNTVPEYRYIKYYANLEMPDYIDSFFAEQAFQRKKVSGDTEKQKDIFYGNNAYIYGLTRYKEFKSLEQKLAVFGALNTPEGYTTLVSLPTGGGKSLITQTMAYQQQGLTIVIVPTVSLAIDQVRNAKNNIKHNADNEIFCYYSGIELERKNALRNAIKSETARLLFISPEALIRNTEFVSMINEANIKKYLKNLIVDEAHIAIEWGDFFRVDYQCLEPWHNELLAINSQLRTVLLSATFTKVAVTKLKQMFASTDKWIEIRCDALRREPRYLLVKAKSYSDKNCKMIELVKKLPHPMVIYINSPKEAEEIKKTLVEGGLDNLETFTGNTKSAERERIIKDWADDKIDLIIATSAFGVGVDKGDVRTVLHLYVPDTPNQYY